MVTKDAKIEFSRRLNEILDDANFTPKHQGRQEELRKIFDVSQKGARKWLEGESIPRHPRILRMVEIWPVRAEWLEYGTLPKYPPITLQVQNSKHGHTASEPSLDVGGDAIPGPRIKSIPTRRREDAIGPDRKPVFESLKIIVVDLDKYPRQDRKSFGLLFQAWLEDPSARLAGALQAFLEHSGENQSANGEQG